MPKKSVRRHQATTTPTGNPSVRRSTGRLTSSDDSTDDNNDNGETPEARDATVAELKAYAEAEGVTVTGTKAAILATLTADGDLDEAAVHAAAVALAEA